MMATNDRSGDERQRARAALPLLTLCGVAALLGIAAGCAQGRVSLPNPWPRQNAATQFTEEDLRGRLAELTRHCVSLTVAAMDRIADESSSREIQRTSIVWKAGLVPMLRRIAYGGNPRDAFVSFFYFAVSLRLYVTEGDGRDIFVEQQHIAVEAARQLESDVREVGLEFLPPEALERVAALVETLATDNPIVGSEYSQSGIEKGLAGLNRRSSLRWIADYPLAPFRAAEGIDQASVAIREFNVVARQFADVAEDLPRQTRWQLDLLLFELEDWEMATEGLAAFQQLAASAERGSLAIERLPESLGAVMSDSRATLGEMNDLISSAMSLLAPLQATVEQARLFSDTWALILADDEEEGEPSGRPFDVREYGSAAREIGTAASELSLAAAEIFGFLNDPTLPMVDSAASSLSRIVDLAAWRGLQLLLAAFALGLAYRFVATRFLGAS